VARRVGASRSGKSNGATLGFEAKLWQAADLLRNNLDAAQYKHVVLGLIFLKYISDAFEERRSELARLCADPSSDYFTESTEIRHEVLEDRDEYRSHNVFWVPGPARWEKLRAAATQPEIGRLVDDAMIAIEHENPSLRGVLNKEYARPDLDKQNLGRLIDLVSNIGLGDTESRGKDLLGRVYEYFLGQFASAEGKKGGQFYTPRHVVRVLVEMLEPFNGRVFDPCCGSGGMFVQSERFVESHGGRRGAVAIYGQESNPTTWRLAKMNLAIRGIDADLGPQPDDSFTHDLHPDLRADFVLANPPFNDSNWKGQLLREDKRWVYGVPPEGNANFAWVQHFIHHLTPNGTTGFVLANGSMSARQSGEGEIRRRIVEADLVDCIVALPGQLFYSTPIPVSLWFLTRNKAAHGFRDRRGSSLFIDGHAMGSLVDRTHRQLTDHEIGRIAVAYHAWRGESGAGAYADVPGFCKSASTEEIGENAWVLTPGRYVGAELAETEAEPYDASMRRLSAELGDLFSASDKLESKVRSHLTDLGFPL
jgi:type I restriction enzyme M protein